MRVYLIGVNRMSQHNNSDNEEVFFQYYEKELKPVYKKFEVERIKLLKKIYTFLGYCLLLFTLQCLFVFILYFFGIRHLFHEEEIDMIPLIFLEIMTVCSIMVIEPKTRKFFLEDIRQYRKNVQRKIMPKLLKLLGEFKYSHFTKEKLLEKSNLFFKSENDNLTIDGRTRFNDCFNGQYKNTTVYVSEKRYIINNIFILIDLNKKIKGDTEVYETKYGMDFWIGILVVLLLCSLMLFKPLGFFYYISVGIMWIGPIYKKYSNREKYKKTKLEDVKFSKNWKINTTDPIETRYILTPAFMERMLALKKVFRGRKINFSFWKHYLLIVISSYHNWFETATLFKSIINYKSAHRCFNQIQSILSVIDILKLHKK